MDHDATHVFNPKHKRATELAEWIGKTEKNTLRPINQGRADERVSSKLESGRLVLEMQDMFQSDPTMMQQMAQ